MAVPLQPRGRSQDGNGVQWTIQATNGPNHWIYVLQHGDVLISKLQEEKHMEASTPYSILVSTKILQHLQNANDQVDPWISNGPWTQPNKAKHQATNA